MHYVSTIHLPTFVITTPPLLQQLRQRVISDRGEPFTLRQHLTLLPCGKHTALAAHRSPAKVALFPVRISLFSLMALAMVRETGKPSLASLIAGANSSERGSRPNLFRAYCIPLSWPGTAMANGPACVQTNNRQCRVCSTGQLAPSSVAVTASSVPSGVVLVQFDLK